MRIKRLLVTLGTTLVMVGVLFFPATGVQALTTGITRMATSIEALTTANITLYATPKFIAISCNVTSYDFGAVAESDTPSTPTGFFAITNTSSVTSNVTIGTVNATWTGYGATTNWTHDDGGAAGANQAALLASNGTAAFDVIVQNITPLAIYADLPAGVNFTFELQLQVPTVFDDGVRKANICQLTISTT